MQAFSTVITISNLKVIDGKNHEISDILSISNQPIFVPGAIAHPSFINRSLICISNVVDVNKITISGYVDVSVSWSWRLGSGVYSKRYMSVDKKNI